MLFNADIYELGQSGKIAEVFEGITDVILAVSSTPSLAMLLADPLNTLPKLAVIKLLE